MMDFLDSLFSGLVHWRRWRGGVWERWHMEGGGTEWWGPMGETTDERKAFLAGRKLPAFASVNDTLSLLYIAHPTIGCRGTPEVEDYRQGLHLVK